MYDAAYRASRANGKDADALRFMLHLEPAIIRLHRELQSGSYRPGAFHTFTLWKNKRRQIRAGPPAAPTELAPVRTFGMVPAEEADTWQSSGLTVNFCRVTPNHEGIARSRILVPLDIAGDGAACLDRAFSASDLAPGEPQEF